MGCCVGVTVTPKVGVGAIVTPGVRDDGLLLVSIAGTAFSPCVECNLESAKEDVATMPITIRQVITAPIHLHLKKRFALFVPRVPTCVDVWAMT